MLREIEPSVGKEELPSDLRLKKMPSDSELAWQRNRERIETKMKEVEGKFPRNDHGGYDLKELNASPEMHRLLEDLYFASPAVELRLPAVPGDPTYIRAKIVYPHRGRYEDTMIFWNEDGTFRPAQSNPGWVLSAIGKLEGEVKKLTAEREGYRKHIGGVQSNDQELLAKMDDLRKKIDQADADLRHLRIAAREFERLGIKPEE